MNLEVFFVKPAMASFVGLLARIPGKHVPVASSSSLRHFSSSSPALARRVKAEEKLTSDQAFDLLNDEYDDDDSASAGHLMLRQQRQVLYYLRLIEHEMPKLAGQFSRTFHIRTPRLTQVKHTANHSFLRHTRPQSSCVL